MTALMLTLEGTGSRCFNGGLETSTLAGSLCLLSGESLRAASFLGLVGTG